MLNREIIQLNLTEDQTVTFLPDEYDDTIVGTIDHCDKITVVYNKRKILKTLMDNDTQEYTDEELADGFSKELSAIEGYEYNMVYVPGVEY